LKLRRREIACARVLWRLWRTFDQFVFLALMVAALRGLWLLNREIPMDWVLPAVVFVIVLAFATICFFRMQPDAAAEDGAPMSTAGRRFLVWYLIALGLCIAYSLVLITSADFPEAGWEVKVPTPLESVPAQSKDKPDGRQASNAPVLRSVTAQANPGNPSIVTLNIFGENFTRDSKVRVKQHDQPTTYIGAQWLQAQVEQQSFVGSQPSQVDVFTADNLQSTIVGVELKRAFAQVKWFGIPVPLTRELQLLLLALFAGALGSYVHALKSLSDFIGNRTLTASWFWWYITRPFLGMAMAVIFYAVLRGGFLTGTPADAKVVNPFGVLAIGALVGMFADKAAQKLGEVFDTLFKSADPRGGKLAAPVISKLEPDSVLKGTQPFVLRITGERMGNVSKVRIKTEERKPDSVNDQQVTLTLKPEDVAASGEVAVTVVDPEAGASPAAILHVFGLVTAKPLPDATANTDYSYTIGASGGKDPYTFSLINPPQWLSIEAGTGKLSGKPPAAGTSDVEVKVTDKNGISTSETLPLKVN
jgi:hypothetical protein